MGRDRGRSTLEASLDSARRRCKSSYGQFRAVAKTDFGATKFLSTPQRGANGSGFRMDPWASFRNPGGTPYNPVGNARQF